VAVGGVRRHQNEHPRYTKVKKQIPGIRILKNRAQGCMDMKTNRNQEYTDVKTKFEIRRYLNGS
jgi:hypothetical protein